MARPSTLLFAIIGFLCSTAGAFVGGWNLKAFCWGVWISGLSASLLAVAISAIRALFIPPSAVRRFLDASDWFKKRISPLPDAALWLIHAAVASAFALIMARLLLFLFGFYGIFLSFFAESEPLDLLGRNGFINSDFITPVAHLLSQFWPMVLGGMIADLGELFRVNPWPGLVRPFSRELAPLHVFVLLMPFITLLFFLLLGEGAYEFPAIVVLLALYHFFPRESRAGPSDRSTSKAGP